MSRPLQGGRLTSDEIESLLREENGNAKAVEI